MTTRWVWPTEEQRVTILTLGPYTNDENVYATWLVQFFVSLPSHLQHVLLQPVRSEVKALVHFMCADRSGGEVRERHCRHGLQELGFTVIYQI